MRSLEILAPVGSAEMLPAAVFAGADAVYLGLESFNARRTAGNFTAEALLDAVKFCHARGVRVFVALNTVVYPTELPLLEKSICDIVNAGADAVIVQDLGVASLVRQIAPSLALHASTQMSVHSLAGAKQLADMGFSRVILARELSLAEIAHIAQNCGIEVEVFVHGALCMSVSGQCYLSAFLGGRSGNRGGCAGPCRLPFSAGEAGEHHLSLKDESLIDNLPSLADAGVASVKIEGRLRSPEYVAAAVNACVSARGGDAYDKQLLQDVFSRSGFTNGYLMSKIDGDMFGIRTGEDSVAAKLAAPKLRELFRRELARVAVQMTLILDAEGSKLIVADGEGGKGIAYGETPPAPAQKTPDYARSLGKTGGTPFYLDKLTVEGDAEQYIPMGEVNEMRRAALESLLQKREVAKPFLCAVMPALPRENHAKPPRILAASFESLAQMPEEAAACDMLILPISEWETIPENLRAKTWLALPRMLFGSAEQAAEKLVDASRDAHFAGYYVQNLNHIKLCAGTPMFGGFGLNVTNSVAASAYAALGLQNITLSPEILCSDMMQIAPENVQTAALLYGHMPLMVTRACPLQNVRDCKDCPREGDLLDRTGKYLPVRCSAPAQAGVRTVYNPIPLYMGDKRGEIAADIALLMFTLEDQDEAAEILELFRKGRPYLSDFTRGLYFKGTQ